MKIELEYPYNSLWNNGYIVVNPENRRTVILYNSSQERSSVSYARYLMAVKEKRFLLKDEHVDHIDDDKTNDSIKNLQILSPLENSKKAGKGITLQGFVCPECGICFQAPKNQSEGRNVRYCSRKCASVCSQPIPSW